MTYINDTNTIDIRSSEAVYYTDVMFYELTKGDFNENQYISQIVNIRNFVKRSKSKFVGFNDRKNQIDKILNKEIHYSARLCKKMCRRINNDFCSTFITSLAIFTTLVLKILTRTKIYESAIVLRDEKSQAFSEDNLFLSSLNDDINKERKRIFERFYSKNRNNEEMTHFGLGYVNLVFSKFNENIGDKLPFIIPKIERIDGLFLKQHGYTNLSYETIFDITKTSFGIDIDREIWSRLFATYFYNTLKSGETYEFNDIADIVQLFWCIKFDRKLKTKDDKIKRYFPELVC